MRYYPGIAVGHKYGWSQNIKSHNETSSILRDYTSEKDEAEIQPEGQEASEPQEDLNDDVSINSMDGGSRCLEQDCSDDEVPENANTGDGELVELGSEDEELYANHEMYDSD